ncbi:MAG: methyltransferase domain-containing protein [Pleurocapsa sp.]
MWNPEDYAKNSDAQLKWAQELRKNIDLSRHRSILDVGSGDGKITADFSANLPSSKVLGVDSSPEMIAYAARKYPASQYPNLSFNCIDARKLNFEKQFDLIFSNAVLHWVDNHQAFLKGANLALQEGGRLIISCGGQGNAAEILEVFAELTASKPWNAYFNDFYHPYFFCGLQDYTTWLEKYNFAIERLELVPKDMTHKGKEGFAGWIRTTWMPFTKCVPENERENFITQFVDLYLAKYPLDSQGLTHVSMVRLEVDAHKLF